MVFTSILYDFKTLMNAQCLYCTGLPIEDQTILNFCQFTLGLNNYVNFIYKEYSKNILI